MYASDEGSTMSAVAQGTKQRARMICNPSSGGGSCDPSRLREQLSGFDLDWIETGGPDDAREAAQEWDDGLVPVLGALSHAYRKAFLPSGITRLAECLPRTTW